MDGEVVGRQFAVDGTAYDRFMGRYSQPLAAGFADVAGVRPGHRVLDVGCGPGALTAELVARVGAPSVAAIDPSPQFVAACAERHPDVDVRQGSGEHTGFPDASFDRALSQLVFHFVTDGEQVARELFRVLRPGGVAAACVWDVEQGMEMLRLFWDAALAVRPDAPDEARTLRFGRAGEIASVLEAAGFVDVTEHELEVSSAYADVDELWAGFLEGVGPAGAWLVGCDAGTQQAVRDELVAGLGAPAGPFTLHAVARAARGTRPGG